mgnify:CR=1 FL=1
MVEPFPDRGEESVLYLEDNVIPGPPFQRVEDVKAL